MPAALYNEAQLVYITKYTPLLSIIIDNQKLFYYLYYDLCGSISKD